MGFRQGSEEARLKGVALTKEEEENKESWLVALHHHLVVLDRSSRASAYLYCTHYASSLESALCASYLGYPMFLLESHTMDSLHSGTSLFAAALSCHYGNPCLQ